MKTQQQDNNRRSVTHALRWAAAAAVTMAALAAPALADDAAQPATRPSTQPNSDPNVPLIIDGVSPGSVVSLMMNKSKVLTTHSPYKRVSIASPDVADVNPIGPSEMLLTAKKPGSTQLVVWDDASHSQVIDVMVGFDLRALQEQFKQLFPGANIEVTSANGSIVLKGRAPDAQTAARAAQVAAPYGQGVLNFLEVSGGQQVMLQVRFAEVSRSLNTSLGFNAFATDGIFKGGINNGPGASPVGSFAGGSGAAAGTASNIPSVPIFGAGAVGNASFEFFINALRQNNLLRVLAEPNLTSISGEKASFLAGGQFPIPVPQTGAGATTITVDYKEFGVRLNFTPTVLGNGHIRLEVSPEVSDLDFSQSVTYNGFVIPSITTRSVHTTVELNEGQSFALAGLLNNRVNASKNSTPLLGDIPILGALFRSVSYQRSETELVVLVTPRLVSPMNPGQIPRLPGEVWRHPEEAALLGLGDMGGPAADKKHSPGAPGQTPAPFRGRYGFNPAPTTTLTNQ